VNKMSSVGVLIYVYIDKVYVVGRDETIYVTPRSNVHVKLPML